MRLFALVLVVGLAASGQSRFVGTKDGRFVDGAGKPLVLRGFNMADKQRETGYTNFTAADFDRIRSWGMNCVRLAVFWDGVEPQPGKIDQAYLDRVVALVRLAKARGLFVLLDMHQDLYSVKFSDGAPLWATLDDGKPHTKGKVWSDAYAGSEAVQVSLDSFWANKAAPDGVGLQEHYANAWIAVARRFAGETAVVGFDLMNEPAPGSEYAAVMEVVMRDKADPADLSQFEAALNRIAPLVHEFERKKLQPFHQKVADAIRSVDTVHILFLEPAILHNAGGKSALQPLTRRGGSLEPRQAWAPHVYDITTDRAAADNTAGNRIAWMISRQAEVARRLAMPLYIGEWGAYYLDVAAAPITRRHIEEFDRHSASHAYWSYEAKLEGHSLLQAMRPR